MFVVKFFDGKVPTPTDKGSEAVAALGASVAAKVQEYIAAMEKVGRVAMGVRVWWPPCCAVSCMVVVWVLSGD